MSRLFDAVADRLGYRAKNPVVIECSEVAEYYYRSSKDYWSIDDLPTLAPPHPSMFFEYNVPEYIVTDTGKHKTEDPSGSVVGVLITTEGKLPSGIVRETDVRWVLAVTVCIRCPGILEEIHVKASLHLDVNGKSLRYFLIVPYRLDFTEEVQKEINSTLFKYVFPAYMSISLMHCKNVTLTRHDPDAPLSKLSKKHLRKHGRHPLTSYYTLDIEPMKKVLRTEGGMDSGNTLQKALHICRGHFSTYTPERPLFGKHVGTYWTQQHVRGTAEAGTIVKDYRIKL